MFKDLQKQISEFRSEAFLGRYQSAFKLFESIIIFMRRLRGCSNKYQRLLSQTQVTLIKEVQVIREIEGLVSKVMERPNIQKREEQQIKKWKVEHLPGKWNKTNSNTHASSEISSALKSFQYEGGYQKFENVLENDQVKDQIQKSIILPIILSKFYKKPAAKSILLYGNEGVGKRYLVRAIANQTRLPLLEFNLSQKHSPQLLKLLSDLINKNVFVGLYELNHKEQFCDQIFNLIDKVNHSGTGLTIIITSSCPWNLNQHFIHSLQTKYRLSLLSDKGRQILIKANTANQNHTRAIMDLTSNLGHKYILEYCNAANKSNQVTDLHLAVSSDSQYKQFESSLQII